MSTCYVICFFCLINVIFIFYYFFFFFFFQAEDGIRDGHVTGVQTCALPICDRGARARSGASRGSSLPGSAPGRRGSLEAARRRRGSRWSGPVASRLAAPSRRRCREQ